jgi:hypothetical protein
VAVLVVSRNIPVRGVTDVVVDRNGDRVLLGVVVVAAVAAAAVVLDFTFDSSSVSDSSSLDSSSLDDSDSSFFGGVVAVRCCWRNRD